MLRRISWLNLVGLIALSTTLAACGGSSSPRLVPVIPTIVEPPEQPPLDGNPEDFKTEEYDRSWGLEAINAASAYAKGYTGDGVTIGLVDFNFNFASNEVNFHSASRGIDPDLRAIYEAQFDKPASTQPHGQAVAVVAAGIKNDADTHGVAYDAEVIAVDFFSGVRSYQERSNGILYTVSNPYLYAYENGARVINKSLGFDEDDVVSNLPDVDERYTLEFETTAIEAGALIVSSAGNNYDPEPSLSNLNAIDRLVERGILNNGKGALILAGSVDENLEISDFSDRAGDGIARFHYLVAPGEKIVAPWNTEANGPGLYFLSGTSFSAPHITGAAALILDRWPSLTGREVADILFETATDLGEAGVDNIYGQGLLNLDAALQPVGQAKVAVKAGAQPVADAAILLGSAFGDAAGLHAGLKDIMILDSYGRDFQMDASGLVQASTNKRLLEGALNLRRDQQASSLGLGGMALNYSLARDRDFAPTFALTGQAEQSFDPTIDASFEFTGTLGNTTWVIGTGRSLTDALRRQPVDYRTGQTLSVTDANSSPLPGGGGSYMAVGQPVGKNSMVWVGLSLDQDSGTDRHPVKAFRDDSRTQSVGARFEHFTTSASWALEAGLSHEDSSVLGSRSAGSLALAGGADTTWLGASGTWFVSDRISASVSGTATMTRTSAHTGSLFDDVGTILGTSFTARLTAMDVMTDTDQLSLTLHQPLRVESANAHLTVGDRLDIDGNVLFKERQLSLTPSSRELALELAYRTQLGGWFLEANAGQRFNAGHVADVSDTLLLIGLSKSF
ncbi:S8 family peptidase [Kordiimonas lipolytica]|uniref:S8 family peptidase n=1 Tax=Kordiimonas lipolytica TaxID=1662421 RepID=A0ABV8UEP8_9PROT|nr:S8 family peptidase [Kordiimonas lipolytica]